MMLTTLSNARSVDGLFWLLAVGLPLLLAAFVILRRTRNAALWLAPLAAAPALILSLRADRDFTVEAKWLLLGMRAGLDETAQVFLLFTALLWLLAGIFAGAYLKEDAARHRFFAFFLLAMSGNLGLILAQDIVSFYLFFALMSFAAYGLVVHDGSDEARHAGKVYLVLVVIGEALLVPALLLSAQAAGSLYVRDLASGIASSPARDLIVGLALAGFGIKAGALPLHVWLPLAHPVAPTPASAVLSGAMIKAGLLGWLRFLPLGVVALPEWGSLCMAAGMAAAFYGVMVGLAQDNPKTVLAYSSISQMGFITVGIGAGLAAPEAWPLALAAVSLYALHHALAKGSLFLGVGVAKEAGGARWQRGLLLAGLLLPALALAGAPFTSGALAKLWLKKAAASAPMQWADWLSWLLPLAAIGTTLLMARFLFLLWRSEKKEPAALPRGLWLSWAALLIGVAVVAFQFAPDGALTALRRTLSLSAVWPVAMGIFIAWAAWRWLKQFRRWRIPAGDLLVAVMFLLGRIPAIRRALLDVAGLFRRLASPAASQQGTRDASKLRETVTVTEERLRGGMTSGLLFLLLAAALFVLLASSADGR